MTSRQALHELIDSLDEDRVEDLLERVEAELVDVPAMSADDMAAIVRAWRAAAAGKGIPHEEAMRLVGLEP